MLAAVAVLAGAVAPASAKVFHSQKEALELAFPGADDVRSRTVILRAEQVERIQKLARSELPTKIVVLYSGWKDGALQGWAYIDVHNVRTKPEAFLVVLDPQGSVRTLRVLAFHEPLEYLPADRWYRQFDGKPLGERLRVGRDIHGIVGATLSARAVAASVRRVQAFYQVLVEASSASQPPAVSSAGPAARATPGARVAGLPTDPE